MNSNYRGLLQSLIIFICALHINAVFAHAQFLADDTSATPPRVDSSGLKTGPCGGYSRTAYPAFFSPGETITIEWKETVQHPGYFTFRFSSAGDVFTTVLAPLYNDNQDNRNDLPHYYSAMATLPNTTCTECAIQLIQVMTEGGGSSKYFSCADIVIVDPADTNPPMDVTGFDAVAADGDVQLNWINPDIDYYKVLIVQSTNTVIDFPVTQTGYGAGDMLGASTVVYNGNATRFSPGNMTSGNYYYKAFAYDASYNYASGREVFIDVTLNGSGNQATSSESGSGSMFWLVFLYVVFIAFRMSGNKKPFPDIQTDRH